MLKNPIRCPEVRIQIFSETILGEAKRPQIQCLSLKNGFWPVGVPEGTPYQHIPPLREASAKGWKASICSEASLGIVEKMC